MSYDIVARICEAAEYAARCQVYVKAIDIGACLFLMIAFISIVAVTVVIVNKNAT